MRVLQKNRLIAIVRVKKPNIIDTGSKEKSPRCRFCMTIANVWR